LRKSFESTHQHRGATVFQIDAMNRNVAT